MKDTKKRIMWLQPFDYDGIEAYLEKEAKEGWMLESIGSHLWKFRRSEPAKIHYSLVFLPKTSAFDPEKDASIDEFEEYCDASGWQRVCSNGKTHIFKSCEDAPTPIETDERIKLDNIRRSMLTSYLLPLAFIALIMLAGNGGVISLWTSPVYTLTSYTGLLWSITSTILVVAVLICIGIFLLWYRESKSAVESGGSCVSTIRHIKLYYGAMGSIFAALLIVIGAQLKESGGGHALIYIAFVLALLVFGTIAWSIREAFRKKGLSKGMNRFVTTVIIVLMVVVLIGGLISILIWALDDDDRSMSEKNRKMMPLVSEDLRDIGDMEYTYDWGSDRTFVIGRDWGYQETGVDMDDTENGQATYDLDYEIVYVEEGGLYQRCLRELMGNKPLWFMDIGKDVQEKNGWEKVYNPTKATVVYQKDWGDGYGDDWILCYPDKIIRISPAFEITDEDLKVIDEKLGSL